MIYTFLLQTRLETKRFPILQAIGPTRLKSKQEDFAKVKGHKSGSEMVKGSRRVRTPIQLSPLLTYRTYMEFVQPRPVEELTPSRKRN